MESIVAVSLGHSPRNVIGLVIDLVLVVVNFLAVSKIITKAGYSSKWIVVPLAPVVLWAATFILLVIDVRSVAVGGGGTLALPVSLSNFAGLEILDFLSLLATWIFFLIFAFSDWPVGRMPRRAAENPPGRPPFTPASQGPPRQPPPTAPVAPAGSAPAVAASPSTLLVHDAPSPNRTVIYCSWCGKERAVDSHAIHHCGSKERPPAFCMHCGTALPEGAPTCASCGTLATQTSR
jgi:hypothetical protein